MGDATLDDVLKVPPECAPQMNVVSQQVAQQTIQIVTRELLNQVDPEKRRALAQAIADSTVDTAALVGTIFTASATKEFFGWGRNFNVSQKVSQEMPIRSLLRQAEFEKSNLDTSGPLKPEQYSWPRFAGPQNSLINDKPLEIMSLEKVRELALAATSTTSRGQPTYPDGSLTEEQWNFFAQEPGLAQLMQTESPLHIAYEFALGPSPQLHHAMYFGQGSGPDGGLVIEVMNRIQEGNVVSFIAPSTLLSFLRRTATNNLKGLLVFQQDNVVPMQVALDRSVWALGRFNYNVLQHNCENFVSWVLQNIDANTSCTVFQSKTRKQVAQQFGLEGGRQKRH